MTLFQHSSFRGHSPILVLSLLAASACGTNSDSIGALGHADSGAGAGSGTGGAQGQGGVGGAPGHGGAAAGGVLAAGGAVAAGGAAGALAAGGAIAAGGVSADARDSGGQGGPDAFTSVDGSALAQLCQRTGGTLSSGLCCASVGEYPGTCAIGACGCSPTSSHTVPTCVCPGASCFSQTAGCIFSGGTGTGGAGGGGVDAGKIDGSTCVLTDVYCVWGYVYDDKGCPVCAPAPSGDAGAGDVVVSSDATALAALCKSTGGQVTSSQCCTSTGDFPNECLVGACGCSPTNSHTVATCACPASSCFSPATGCTPYTGSTGPDAAPKADGANCTAQPAGDATFCGGTLPPHYYGCILSMLPDPCVAVSIGDVTNGFCCP